MKEDLIEQRVTLVKCMFKGLTVQAVAEDMTKNISDLCEQEKAVRRIRRGWNNRDSWMDLIVRINSKSFLAELTGSVQEGMMSLSFTKFTDNHTSFCFTNKLAYFMRIILFT